MTNSKRMTATQRRHFGQALDVHQEIEEDFDILRVPDAWHEIWRNNGIAEDHLEDVTLAIGTDVIRFFKSMGPGHGARINNVLRAFMFDRLAGVVGGPEERALPDAVQSIDDLEAQLRQASQPDPKD